MSTDDTYAPKSPDLSSFYSAGPTEPALQHLQDDSHGSEYIKPEPPGYAPSSSSSYALPPTSHHHHAHQATHQATHQAAHTHTRNHPLTHTVAHAHAHAQPPHFQPLPSPHQAVKSEYQTYSAQDQHQYLPPRRGSNLPPGPPYGAQPSSSFQPPPPHPASSVYGQPQEEHNHHYSGSLPYDYTQPYGSQPGDLASHSTAPSALHAEEMPPRKAAAPPPPVVDPSPVRTKFPTARIKRIMQADEEVGKVAQQTPIAVGKALEMFMIQMVSKSAEVARDKGSKRVTASMLKQVVETDEQWDFLRDIVSRVENEKEGSKAKAKAESSSDEEMSEPKRKPRGGRKKKAA